MNCDISLLNSSFRGVVEVKIFWTLCGLIFMKALLRIAHSSSFHMLAVIRSFTSIWILASALLLKPCNIVLIPYMVLSSFTFRQILKQTIDHCLVHVWLGYIVFFYQVIILHTLTYPMHGSNDLN